VSPVPAPDFNRYRPLLRLQARLLQLTPRFDRRFDSSDLVQETLLRAHQNREQFRGGTEGELLAWLYEILSHVATDEVRKAKAQKRNLALEQSLEASLADSGNRLAKYLADESSPAEIAERHEQLLRISAAIETLPEDQRDAVIQRDVMSLPIIEIAQRMGRTAKSVASLLYRGHARLRELLPDEGE
jgi:RNA polymerase sigma-70 factor (ECF subfamily)